MTFCLSHFLISFRVKALHAMHLVRIGPLDKRALLSSLGHVLGSLYGSCCLRGQSPVVICVTSELRSSLVTPPQQRESTDDPSKASHTC